ncbi:MAG: nitrous oxide-stimulated promoter family protein [Deltaproteobacteria bacterium]|nr:nitrous oxide-stimulated promoter family protein [Deltaproteobacteria bacterium]
MTRAQARLDRERRTLEAMIRLYCRDLHAGGKTLCQQCEALCCYADVRLQRCVFKLDKPTCAACPVHCYKPEMREQVRVVMRYAGPRMLLRHPVLAIWHLIDGRGEVPELPRRKHPEPGQS